MLATPHMLAGAAIGKLLRRPYLALPAAFASHFALDVVPHIDTYGLFGIPGRPPTQAVILAAALDTVVGIALVIWLTSGLPNRGLILGAAFMGILTDLLDNVPGIMTVFHQIPGALAFSHFHHGIQHNLHRDQWLPGFATQLVVIAGAVWVLREGPRQVDGEERSAG